MSKFLFLILIIFYNNLYSQDTLTVQNAFFPKTVKKKGILSCTQILPYEQYQIFKIYISDSLINVAVMCDVLDRKFRKGISRGEYTIKVKPSVKGELFDVSLNGIVVENYVPFILIDIDLETRKGRVSD